MVEAGAPRGYAPVFSVCCCLSVVVSVDRNQSHKTWFFTDKMTVHGLFTSAVIIAAIPFLFSPRSALVFCTVIAIVAIVTLGHTIAMLAISIASWFVAVTLLIKLFNVNYRLAVGSTVIVTVVAVAKLDLLHGIVLIVVALITLYALRPTERPNTAPTMQQHPNAARPIQHDINRKDKIAALPLIEVTEAERGKSSAFLLSVLTYTIIIIIIIISCIHLLHNDDYTDKNNQSTVR